MSEVDKPFAELGKRLKNYREKQQRSLQEVSGAIEIDEDKLVRYERGDDRPDEDIMLLLINYFDLEDNDALKVWKLAQYDSNLSEHIDFDSGDLDFDSQSSQVIKQVVMLLAMDTRTIYSDGFEVTWNKAGVTFDFTQLNGKQRVSIAKIGMSLEQAENIAKCLETTLLKIKLNTYKKLLPPPNSSTGETSK